MGTALKGNHAGLSRWRVGNYRLIGDIRDSELRIMVISAGHRREVYR
jgi:mRNA interferase RelE/StbE